MKAKEKQVWSLEYKRDWHDKRSKAHQTGGCDPNYRKCKVDASSMVD
jgi:hypothetical protein